MSWDKGAAYRAVIAVVVVLALGGVLVALTPEADSPQVEARPTAAPTSGGQEWPEGLREAATREIATDAYRLHPQEPAGDAWTALNAAQGFDTRFSLSGVSVGALGASGPLAAGPMTMSLTGWGRGGSLQRPGPATLVATENRAEYSRDGLREWYVNDERGIEQGFTVDTRPPGPAGEPLTVELGVGGTLRPRLAPDGTTIELVGPGGDTVLTYGGLHAYDAGGDEVASRMVVDDTAVRLEVDDYDAAYPLTIDPLIATQQAKFTAQSNPGGGDRLGIAVAVDGNTAVMGADLADGHAGVDQGAAYVSVRSGSTWSPGQQLLATGLAANDGFGNTVAVSGDTAVVGAWLDDHSGRTDSGAAYVFVRSGTNWTQQAQLTGFGIESFDWFGASVAISGDTIVVGAAQGPAPQGGPVDVGSAHVFVRSGTTWLEQAALNASDGVNGDFFGRSVAVDGDTAVIGADQDDGAAGSEQGSAYVFVRSGESWTQQVKLLPTDPAASDQVGVDVSLSGNTAVLGAHGDNGPAGVDQGSAYVFVRSGTTWTQQTKLIASDALASDQLGVSVTVSGNTVIAGALGDDGAAGTEQGSAYIFVRSGTTWSQQAKLLPSEPGGGDWFGRGVGLSGETAVAGALFDDGPMGVDQGSAYAFVRSGTTWSQQTKFAVYDDEGLARDRFGFSVAVSGNTAVVGAPGADMPPFTGPGAAYVFVRSGATWAIQVRLTPADPNVGDNFGNAVAIDGNTIVVGSWLDILPGGFNQGSAYVFVRSGTTWAQDFKLTAPDATGGDQFGYSVAISVDTVVVGARLDDHASGFDQGSAYAFARAPGQSNWSFQGKLTAPDAGESDLFGWSVAVSGDTAVVGAPLNDGPAGSDQGAAYVFLRSGIGSTWAHQAGFTATDAAAGDNFGRAIALSGNTLVVGAPFDDGAAGGEVGSAHVYVRSGTSWSFQARLSASDPAGGANFGFSVAIAGETVVAGAPAPFSPNPGAAYVLVRTGTSWAQGIKVTAADAAGGDEFGTSVGLSGTTVVAGAPLKDGPRGVDQGAAYAFLLENDMGGTVADFNGDGRTDIAVFRPSTGTWFISGQATTAFGTNGDVPVPGDYNGDGRTDIAVFRPSTGTWFISGQATTAFGTNGDIPVPGDYNGDGRTDIAVFRPSTGTWFRLGQPTVAFGTNGDIAVPGDYNGDGRTDIAVFRPSNGTWFISGQPTVVFGANGDIPAPGDYNGDGRTDIAVFRPSNGSWFISGEPTVVFGTNGDIPVPGDYTGDGRTDVAVSRPSTGFWFIQGAATSQFGASTDIRVAVPPAVRVLFLLRPGPP